MKSDRRTLLRDGALLFGLTGIAGGPRAARASAGDEDTSSAGHEGRTLGTISGVVDFRVRPPFKSFADSFLFRPRDASSRGSGISRGRPTYRSFQERSMEAFVDEMDAAGIERAVVMARGPQREMAGRRVRSATRTWRSFSSCIRNALSASGGSTAAMSTELSSRSSAR